MFVWSEYSKTPDRCYRVKTPFFELSNCEQKAPGNKTKFKQSWRKSVLTFLRRRGMCKYNFEQGHISGESVLKVFSK